MAASLTTAGIAAGDGRPWHVATTDLIEPLARRGSGCLPAGLPVVADRPERLTFKILMALLDILDCSMSELIEPVAAGGQARTRRPPAAQNQVWASCVPSAPASPGRQVPVMPRQPRCR